MVKTKQSEGFDSKYRQQCSEAEQPGIENDSASGRKKIKLPVFLIMQEYRNQGQLTQDIYQEYLDHKHSR